MPVSQQAVVKQSAHGDALIGGVWLGTKRVYYLIVVK